MPDEHSRAILSQLTSTWLIHQMQQALFMVLRGITCPELHLDESYPERLEADRRERQGEIANYGSKPLVSLKWRCLFVMI